MAKTVAALFESQAAAEQAIESLLANGIENHRIGLLSRSDLAEHPDILPNEPVRPKTVHILEGTVFGGLAGIVIGSAALAMPGVGLVLAAGTLAAMFSAAGPEGMAGLFWDAASELGITHHQARDFAERLMKGEVLVTVQAEAAQAAAAQTLLRAQQPMDVYVYDVPDVPPGPSQSGLPERPD
jgi:hypothetical protein